MLKDILLHADNGKQFSTRLDVAMALARSFDAHLTGLHVVEEQFVPSYVRAEIPKNVLDAVLASMSEQAKAVKSVYDEACRKANVRGEWREATGNTVERIALHARYADIVVIGQRAPDAPPDNGGMPDRLILSAGRPTLVVPYAGRFPTVGKNVMVAWDASRLAARAVGDALPFLKRASNVRLIAINPKGGRDGHGEIPCADIALHLARHGVKAEATSLHADDLGVGDALLSRAADFGSDLIVMGAYGHARWRELVLGGATRHILEHMTVPVLMSH